MAWNDLFAALALCLILEGLGPLAGPRAWRRVLAAVAELGDGQIRGMGALAIAIGLLVLYTVRG